jgi:hypothetical protein
MIEPEPLPSTDSERLDSVFRELHRQQIESAYRLAEISETQQRMLRLVEEIALGLGVKL